jgi:hypothetical protein
LALEPYKFKRILILMTINEARHCERSEAIQRFARDLWIASLRSQ